MCYCQKISEQNRNKQNKKTRQGKIRQGKIRQDKTKKAQDHNKTLARIQQKQQQQNKTMDF